MKARESAVTRIHRAILKYNAPNNTIRKIQPGADWREEESSKNTAEEYSDLPFKEVIAAMSDIFREGEELDAKRVDDQWLTVGTFTFWTNRVMKQVCRGVGLRIWTGAAKSYP